jgi:hypothetical protein
MRNRYRTVISSLRATDDDDEDAYPDTEDSDPELDGVDEDARGPEPTASR